MYHVNSCNVVLFIFWLRLIFRVLFWKVVVTGDSHICASDCWKYLLYVRY